MSDFIEQIASLIKKYAPQYGICVYSPIIAQAVLESASGTSNKVTNGRNNYFGLKWRNNRCAISNEYFEEWTAEQKSDGTYSNIVSKFCKFNSLEDCVIGYFQWTNISNYANLKGITDPEQYLENIKADKYATSINYVENLMNVIKKYNLTQYDDQKGDNKMVINVHAGHNPDGKIACGAISIIKESTEARAVKNEVIRQLQKLGHTVNDCTVDNGTSQSDVLKKIVAKCNAHAADLDISIHFNAGANDKSGNGKSTGTEVYVYSANSKAKEYADRVCAAIASIGFKSRGTKISQSLYVLKNTNAPAMLVECCFVDDADDVKLYDYQSMASAIVKGITGQTVSTEAPAEEEQPAAPVVKSLYRVQVGAYSIAANATAMQEKLKKAGFDAILVKS
ncbi:MAG: N-acetylmuramoyl-L-alanine amidase [Lachnospiraceae bacterium]|nr:N-acetylmuramoyl-L-alanine amidase [Lachnospiraceae bacterium]